MGNTFEGEIDRNEKVQKLLQHEDEKIQGLMMVEREHTDEKMQKLMIFKRDHDKE